MRCYPRLIAALTVALLLVAGCGSDEPSGTDDTETTSEVTTTAAEAGAVEACGLLTEDDVAPLVGAGSQPESGQVSPDSGSDTCSWRQADAPPDEEAKLLTLTVGDASTYAELKASQPEATAVTGVGTEAFSAVGSTGPLVVATDGDHTYQVQLAGGTDADIPALEELVRTTMSNLDSPEPVNNPDE